MMIDLEILHAQARADERRPVVGALILDRRGRVFVHRRGPDRAFLPNGWDLVGGHVEAGETLLQALRREVTEETGWTVGGTPQLVFVGDWWADPSDPSSARREFDFLIDAEGDLDRPRLEWPKHTEFRWIDASGVTLLDENGGRDDGLVRHLAEIALRSAAPDHDSRPHAGLFLDSSAAQPVERLRRRGDPALASQIAAHVTLAYPGDVNSLDELLERTRRAASLVVPFHLRLGPVHRREGAHVWVGLAVIDPDGGWRRLRELIVPPLPGRSDDEPHVTIVHPRHSNLGSQAWEAVRTLDVAGEVAVAEIAITVFDGRVWRTVERLPLGPR